VRVEEGLPIIRSNVIWQHHVARLFRGWAQSFSLQEYQQSFRTFREAIASLKTANDVNLKFLGFRLDFNEYYIQSSTGGAFGGRGVVAGEIVAPTQTPTPTPKPTK
jgi:hypothetical protein